MKWQPLRDLHENKIPVVWVSATLNPRRLKVERSRNLTAWYTIKPQIAKRWISADAARLQFQPITLLGDDRYSHQPLCEHCWQHQLGFSFTCLPESHPALYDGLGYLEANGAVKTLEQVQWNKRTQEIARDRDVNQIP